MAARTTVSSGAVSNATGTNLGEGGTPLGTTDTLTASHTINFDANTECGTSPATGGTAALVLAAGVNASISIDADVELELKGPMNVWSSISPFANAINLDEGSVLRFVPASGQQYDLTVVDSDIFINVTGTAENPATIETDLSAGGVRGGFSRNQNYEVGFYQVDHLIVNDFIGFTTDLPEPASGITALDSWAKNVTLNSSNYALRIAYAGWDGDYLMEDVVFNDSETFDIAGAACCAYIYHPFDSGSVAYNRVSFDAIVSIRDGLKEATFSNCFIPSIQGAVAATAYSSTDDQFKQNLFYSSFNLMAIVGYPAKDCYFANLDSDNPHFLQGNTHTRCIYDSPSTSNTGDGDVMFGGNNLYCVVVPGGNDNGTGLLGHGGTYRHCTVYGKSEAAMIYLNEASAVTNAGDQPVANDNFVWSEDASPSCLVIHSFTTGVQQAIDTVTESLNNALRNGHSGDCIYNSVTPQANVLGYDNVKISHVDPIPNSQIGGMVTITTDVHVGNHRRLTSWGEEIHSTDGTHEAAAAICQDDPSQIYLAGDNALIPWTLAGIRVTGAEAESLLKDAGTDDITIGAGEFVAGVAPAGGSALAAGMHTLTGGIS